MTAIDSYSHDVSGEKEFGFAQAIKVGDTIYVSGQLSHDEQGNFLYPGDFDAQLKQSYANFEKVLAHYGATRNQVAPRPSLVDDVQVPRGPSRVAKVLVSRSATYVALV
jgi:2-iminobutanoate/2-iminopropanoate deaminase